MTNQGALSLPTSRRSLLKTAAAGAALAAGWLPTLPAIAATRRLVVTTMPGPRWHGALRASAAADQAVNSYVQVDIPILPYIAV